MLRLLLVAGMAGQTGGGDETHAAVTAAWLSQWLKVQQRRSGSQQVPLSGKNPLPTRALTCGNLEWRVSCVAQYSRGWLMCLFFLLLIHFPTPPPSYCGCICRFLLPVFFLVSSFSLPVFSLSVCFSLCLSLCFCLCLCLSFSLYFSLSPFPSLSPSLSLSVFLLSLPVSSSLSVFAYACVTLSVSVSLSTCLSLCLSACTWSLRGLLLLGYHHNLLQLSLLLTFSIRHLNTGIASSCISSILSTRLPFNLSTQLDHLLFFLLFIFIVWFSSSSFFSLHLYSSADSVPGWDGSLHRELRGSDQAEQPEAALAGRGGAAGELHQRGPRGRQWSRGGGAGAEAEGLDPRHHPQHGRGALLDERQRPQPLGLDVAETAQVTLTRLDVVGTAQVTLSWVDMAETALVTLSYLDVAGTAEVIPFCLDVAEIAQVILSWLDVAQTVQVPPIWMWRKQLSIFPFAWMWQKLLRQFPSGCLGRKQLLDVAAQPLSSHPQCNAILSYSVCSVNRTLSQQWLKAACAVWIGSHFLWSASQVLHCGWRHVPHADGGRRVWVHVRVSGQRCQAGAHSSDWQVLPHSYAG